MILYFRKTIKKYKLEAPAATDVDGRIDADPPKYVGSNFTTSSSSSSSKLLQGVVDFFRSSMFF